MNNVSDSDLYFSDKIRIYNYLFLFEEIETRYFLILIKKVHTLNNV